MNPDQEIRTVAAAGDCHILLADARGLAFGSCHGLHAEDLAARLALCWNACRSVPTAELLALKDEGGVAALLELLEREEIGGDKGSAEEAWAVLDAQWTVTAPAGDPLHDGPFFEE